MARSYAPLMLSIWQDEQFRGLTVEAQHLYMTLISQPSTNYCGVTPLMPGRWSKLSDNNTTSRTRKALAELERTGFVMVDGDTEEVWIRSFGKHNGVFKQTNVWKSAANSYGHIASSAIRKAFYLTVPPDKRQELASPFGPDDPPPDGHREPQGLPQGLGQALPQGLPQGEPLVDSRGYGYTRVVSGFDLYLDLDRNLEPQPEPSSSSADDDDPPRWALIEAERRLAARPAHLDEVVDRQAWLRHTADRVQMSYGADVACWLAEAWATDEALAARVAKCQQGDAASSQWERAQDLLKRGVI